MKLGQSTERRAGLGVNGVRALGSVCLSSHPRVLLWRVVARRAAADGGAAMVLQRQAAASCSALLSSEGMKEKREGREKEGAGQHGFDCV